MMAALAALAQEQPPTAPQVAPTQPILENAGKPMLVCVHGTVGLLHGSMALFQAWADRVPVVLIVGMQLEPTGIVNLPHSAQDLGVIVRDFVKFDDETTSLQRFAESAMRGYQLAMTPPRGPVMLVVPTELQEEEIGGRDRPIWPARSVSFSSRVPIGSSPDSIRCSRCCATWK